MDAKVEAKAGGKVGEKMCVNQDAIIDAKKNTNMDAKWDENVVDENMNVKEDAKVVEAKLDEKLHSQQDVNIDAKLGTRGDEERDEKQEAYVDAKENVKMCHVPSPLLNGQDATNMLIWSIKLVI